MSIEIQNNGIQTRSGRILNAPVQNKKNSKRKSMNVQNTVNQEPIQTPIEDIIADDHYNIPIPKLTRSTQICEEPVRTGYGYLDGRIAPPPLMTQEPDYLLSQDYDSDYDSDYSYHSDYSDYSYDCEPNNNDMVYLSGSNPSFNISYNAIPLAPIKTQWDLVSHDYDSQDNLDKDIEEYDEKSEDDYSSSTDEECDDSDSEWLPSDNPSETDSEEYSDSSSDEENECPAAKRLDFTDIDMNNEIHAQEPYDIYADMPLLEEPTTQEPQYIFQMSSIDTYDDMPELVSDSDSDTDTEIHYKTEKTNIKREDVKREDVKQPAPVMIPNPKLKGEQRRSVEHFVPFTLSDETWQDIVRCRNCDYFGFPCLNCAEHYFNLVFGKGCGDLEDLKEASEKYQVIMYIKNDE
jgi:hypothetical protein